MVICMLSLLKKMVIRMIDYEKAFDEVEEFINEIPLSNKGFNTIGQSQYISDKLNQIEDALNDYTKIKEQNGIYISKEEVNELLIIIDKLDSEIDWSQANISWEDTYLKLINKLGGTHGN